MDLTVSTTDTTQIESATLRAFLSDMEQFEYDSAASLAKNARKIQSFSRTTTASAFISATSPASPSFTVTNTTAYVSQKEIQKAIVATKSVRTSNVSAKLKPIDYDLLETVQEGTWDAFLSDVHKFFRNFFKSVLQFKGPVTR